MDAPRGREVGEAASGVAGVRPAEDAPNNTRHIRIKKVYEALLNAGEKEAAAELRGLDWENQQGTAAREIRRELLGDKHAQHARR